MNRLRLISAVGLQAVAAPRLQAIAAEVSSCKLDFQRCRDSLSAEMQRHAAECAQQIEAVVGTVAALVHLGTREELSHQVDAKLSAKPMDTSESSDSAILGAQAAPRSSAHMRPPAVPRIGTDGGADSRPRSNMRNTVYELDELYGTIEMIEGQDMSPTGSSPQAVPSNSADCWAEYSNGAQDTYFPEWTDHAGLPTPRTAAVTADGRTELAALSARVEQIGTLVSQLSVSAHHIPAVDAAAVHALQSHLQAIEARVNNCDHAVATHSRDSADKCEATRPDTLPALLSAAALLDCPVRKLRFDHTANLATAAARRPVQTLALHRLCAVSQC